MIAPALVLVAALGACTPGGDEKTPGLSPGAARLLIPEAELGEQAQKLLSNLKSDPFVYFRFINRPWARAVCRELGPVLSGRRKVHLHGDAHVGQYAFTRTSHGLDDLDDSIRGPAALDVVRFLASLDLATRDRGWPAERERLFDEFFEGYRAALMDRDYEPPVPGYVTRSRVSLVYDELEHLAWAESLMRPVAEMDDQGIEEGRQRLAALVAAERPDLPSFYLEPKTFGWLRMGVGSALTPKLLLRCEGRTRADEDDFLLEARELSDLRGVSCVDLSASDMAARILEGYGRLGRIPHDLVVVVPSSPEPRPGAREWWARTWEASYRELSLDQLASPDELAEIVHAAAAQLGNGHAWTPTGDPGTDLRDHKLRWLEEAEPRARALAVRMTQDLVEAWKAFRMPSEP